jgi:putative phage-type endonuclease
MILDIHQGSDEWLELRRTKVCASDASVILGISPWMDTIQLYEEKLGLREPKSINSAMQRGMILEPKARSLFENKYGILMTSEVILHPIDDWMLSSLDGMSLDGKSILEIKCTNRKNHDLAMSGKIPDHYYPQVQHQIECAGVDFCYYCSFYGDDICVVVVKRDNTYIHTMKEREYEFYQCMINRKEPKVA